MLMLSVLVSSCNTQQEKFVDVIGEFVEGEVYPEQSKNEFLSLAYLSTSMIGLYQVAPENVASYLDKYHWGGISDVAIIKGVFMTGKDGSIITSWNKETWPEVSEEAITYENKKLDENKERNSLCSKEVVIETIKYFKRKGVRIWFCQQGYGWLSRNTSQEIVLQNPELTKKYANNLINLCKEFDCYGVDFDDEFPSAAATEGYHNLMRMTKASGFKVGVCAQQTYEAQAHADMNWEKIVSEGIVDHINSMHYTAGLCADESSEARMKVRVDAIDGWEQNFPQCFKGNDTKVKFLSGIGYYTSKKPALNMMKLYEKYGEKAYTQGTFDDETFAFTTDNVKAAVQLAKDRGWAGVFTWLTSHDFTTDHPAEYSRQKALESQVNKIWSQENNL